MTHMSALYLNGCCSGLEKMVTCTYVTVVGGITLQGQKIEEGVTRYPIRCKYVKGADCATPLDSPNPYESSSSDENDGYY